MDLVFYNVYVVPCFVNLNFTYEIYAFLSKNLYYKYICVCICVCCYSQEGISKNMFVGWKKDRQTLEWVSESERERLNKDKHMGKQGLWNIKIIYDVWSSYTYIHCMFWCIRWMIIFLCCFYKQYLLTKKKQSS